MAILITGLRCERGIMVDDRRSKGVNETNAHHDELGNQFTYYKLCTELKNNVSLSLIDCAIEKRVTSL